jgi:hypothetical protein
MANHTFRDERMIAVENASYKLGFTVLVFGLLFDMVYRNLIKRGSFPDPLALTEGNWDLMGLVILSSGLATAYQWHHRILGHIKARRILASMATTASAVLGLRLLQWFGLWE